MAWQKKQKKQVKKQVWTPPPNDFLNINTDGAFRHSHNSGGWGFTIKNYQGLVLIAGAGNLLNVTDPIHTEALGMLHAINEAARLGCQRIIPDAAVLKQAITTDAYDGSNLSVIFKEIKTVIRLSFQSCKVEVCPPSCNISAHCWAAYGAGMEQESYQLVWLDPLPNHVKDLLAGTMSSLLS